MITGIILAGGESKRFNSEKGLALLKGKPLVEWVTEALRPLCGEILISSNSSSYHESGFRVIPDTRPGNGPMMGIYSALSASATEDNIILSVDTPLVSTALLQYIFDSKARAMVVVPQSGINHYEPLIGYYSKSSAVFMEAAFEKGNYKLPDFFQTIPFRGLNLNTWDGFTPGLLANVNTPGDLSLLEAMPL